MSRDERDSDSTDRTSTQSQPKPQSQPQPQSTSFALPELNFGTDPITTPNPRGVSDLRSRFESFHHEPPIPPRLPPKTPLQSTSSTSSPHLKSHTQLPLRPPKPSSDGCAASSSSSTPPSLNLPLPSPSPSPSPDPGSSNLPRSPGVSTLRSRFDGSSLSAATVSTPGGRLGEGKPMSTNIQSERSTRPSKTVPIPPPGQVNRATSYGFPSIPATNSPNGSSGNRPAVPPVPAKPNGSIQVESPRSSLSFPKEPSHLRNASFSSVTGGDRNSPSIPSKDFRSRTNSENSSKQNGSSSNHPYSRGSVVSSSSSQSLNQSSNSATKSPEKPNRIETSSASSLPQAAISKAPPLPSRQTGGFDPHSTTKSTLDSPLPPPPQRIQSSNTSAGSSQILASSAKLKASPQSMRPSNVEPDSNGFSTSSTLPTLPPPVRSVPVSTSSTLPVFSNNTRSIRPSEDSSEESDLDDEFDFLNDGGEFETDKDKVQHDQDHSKSAFGAISSSLSAWKHGRKMSKSFHHQPVNGGPHSLGSSSPSSVTSNSPLPPPIRPPNSVGESSSNRLPRKDNDLPDSSNMNRRPPTFNPDCSISSKSSFHDFSIFGHTIVTACDKGVKVYRIGQTAHNGGEKLCSVGEGGKQSEHKLTKVTVRADHDPIEEGRFVWCGTKSGEIWELDCVTAKITMSRLNLHSSPIALLTRVGKRGGMLSLDEGGKLCVWCPDPNSPINLASSPRTQRIPMDKHSVPLVLGDQLWICSPGTENSKSSSAQSYTSPKIRIYNPFSDDKPFNAVSRPVQIPSNLVAGIGSVTCGTIIPTSQDLIYLGHDSGHVSIWNRSSLTCIKVQKLGSYGVNCMVGLVSNLWIGNKTGKISIYRIDDRSGHWIVVKRWQAHPDPIVDLKVDINPVDGKQRLQVASSGADSRIRIWDGLLSFDWLENQLNEKEIQKTFCSERDIRILQCTFNIDASHPSELEEGDELELNWLEQMLKSGRRNYDDENSKEEILPDIIVFGLQEVIDLESKALTAKSLLMGKKKGPKENWGERVSHQYRAWHDKLVLAVRLALPATTPYKPILSESLVGLFSIVFVKVSELAKCRDLAVSTIKTGMGGRYGNKGAVVSRFVLDDTSFCFTNCHLAAGQKHVRQRNNDVADILEASPFEGLLSDPLAYLAGGEGSMILDHSKVFLSGDLNYRIDQPRSTILSLLASGKLSSLLPSDQLLTQLSSNPTFRLREFQEAQIDFLPSYKLDRGSDEWDSSDKKRIPAWCDRILWRCKVQDDVRNREYRRWNTRISDHRPVSAVFDVKSKSLDPSLRAQASRILMSSWEVVEKNLLDDASEYYSAL